MKRVYANLLGNWTGITDAGKIPRSDAAVYIKEELQDMFKYDYVNVEYGGVRYPNRYGVNSVSSILDNPFSRRELDAVRLRIKSPLDTIAECAPFAPGEAFQERGYLLGFLEGSIGCICCILLMHKRTFQNPRCPVHKQAQVQL